MTYIQKLICTLLTFIFGNTLAASEVKIVEANNIQIWCETFGEPKDPALLLIMGGLCQGILWPTEFCQQLADQGFYVIRYDNRDTGYSTCFDFQKDPYDLLDMAKDAAGLLDALNIKSANVCGLSMGGPIAELLSVHFPEKVRSLTLIATSSDLRPSSLAYDKDYPQDLDLPRPTEKYLQWMHAFLQKAPQTEAEQLEQRVECWAILNGSIVPFEEARYREIHAEFLHRLKHPESLTNHLDAVKKSFQLILEVPAQIRVPTVVIHGTEDPILPPIHGQTLAQKIPSAKFILLQGFGHVPNSHFYPDFISAITSISK